MAPPAAPRTAPDERKLFCEIAIMSYCPGSPSPAHRGARMVLGHLWLASQPPGGDLACHAGRAVLLGAEASLLCPPPPGPQLLQGFPLPDLLLFPSPTLAPPSPSNHPGRVALSQQRGRVRWYLPSLLAPGSPFLRGAPREACSSLLGSPSPCLGGSLDPFPSDPASRGKARQTQAPAKPQAEARPPGQGASR